jgi:HK97 gp10 family phage protein
MPSPTNQSFKVEGFDELFKAMDELASEIGKTKTDKIWKKALGYAFLPVLESARDAAPTDTGQLKEHVYMKVQKPSARDKSSNKYQGESFMARVTVGPKRIESVEHTHIVKKEKEKTIYKNPPVALAMEFGTAKVSAQPFMRPALENNVDRVISRLGYSVMAAIEAGKWVKPKG